MQRALMLAALLNADRAQFLTRVLACVLRRRARCGGPVGVVVPRALSVRAERQAVRAAGPAAAAAAAAGHRPLAGAHPELGCMKVFLKSSLFRGILYLGCFVQSDEMITGTRHVCRGSQCC